MKNALILIVSHRGLRPETADAVEALNCPSGILASGLTNLAKARSIAFDQALAVLEREPSLDVVLSIDDDMVFRPEDAQRLLDVARQTNHPQSGIYLKVEADRAVIAARHRPSELVLPRPRWYAGLGFMAIPRAALERLAPTLPTRAGIRVWCDFGAHREFPNEWIGEDFWFSALFGGVEIAAIPAGHLKPAKQCPWLTPPEGSDYVALWPDDATVRQFFENGRPVR